MTGKNEKNRIEKITKTLVPYLVVATISFFFVYIFFVLSGFNAISIFKVLMEESIGGVTEVQRTLLKMTPLLFTGLAGILTYNFGLWNIGMQGQFTMGVIMSGIAALFFKLPPFLMIPLVLIFGFLGGAIWGSLAGFLRTKIGVELLLSTLLLSFISGYLLKYCVHFPLRDPEAFNPVSKFFPKSAVLPKLLPNARIHIGIIIGIILAFLVLEILVKRTHFGYKARIVGTSPEAAKFGGINANRIVVILMFLSGGIAGLGGAIEATGVWAYLNEGMTSNYGWLGIAIGLTGMKLGKGTAIGIILVALFFGILKTGSRAIHSVYGVSMGVVFIFQAIILISVLLIPILQEILPQVKN
ncbi:hypothetical protein AKJ37_03250 [candidate division MSBL1 archaeon SCGC-AAA259I09]|uniref:ABC transporter permease n=1 Tax=candidate division MSBL1 archaeon SCGC-AAA259I09 TaxID=1698267 RepID=A0A133UT41_9EURY|nr:hypothetical protein AKJ37_03250 [candidate division MSBL1 archaeon SCGC-AAA259I09]